jgi:Pyruvate/2-oxoacid:ferredoxin oxidoreductase gamma subunit
MVMLGAFCRGTDLLPREAVTWAIESVNPKWAAPNLAAFEKGFGFVDQPGS